MDNALQKDQRLTEVTALIDSFCGKHLTEELGGYVRELWCMLGRKRSYRITGGRPEIWAAAVVYVIARVNFLFDNDNPQRLTADQICEFFATKKSTVSARASDIEKACKIKMGHPGLCNSRLSDSLTVVQLPNGLVVPVDMARSMGLIR